MTTFKPLQQKIINDIRHSNKLHGICLNEFAKSSDLAQFSDTELTEMYNGFYIDKKILLTDGDYVIDLKKVKSAYCTLSAVTYIKKPTLENYKNNRHNVIANIKTFYIENYFLITDEYENWGTEHKITRRLLKAGAFKQGTANFRNSFRIKNDYSSLQKFLRGEFSKDLYYPIKQFINGLFFEDDYRIADFYVESDIKITA